MDSIRRSVAGNNTVKILTCEAGGSIKPGAQAPGSIRKHIISPRSGRQPVLSRAVARVAGGGVVVI
jgi:hypothetical protein